MGLICTDGIYYKSLSSTTSSYRSCPPVSRSRKKIYRATSIFGAAGGLSNGSSIINDGSPSSSSRRRRRKRRSCLGLVRAESQTLQKSGRSFSTTSSANSALDQLDIERGVCVPFRKYTPQTVRNKVLESRGAILSLVGRGVEIVWNLGIYWSALMYDCFVGRDEEVVPFRARQLRNLLCDLGPSFIKAGQVLANRPDIVREDYMNELCILQDDVPPFPNQVAFDIIEEELGQPLEAVFSKISSETIAAASLGQVYRATLRASGEDVAIKTVDIPIGLKVEGPNCYKCKMRDQTAS